MVSREAKIASKKDCPHQSSDSSDILATGWGSLHRKEYSKARKLNSNATILTFKKYAGIDSRRYMSHLDLSQHPICVYLYPYFNVFHYT